MQLFGSGQCCVNDAEWCLACRDSFVGDAQALVAPKMAPWAAAAGRHQEESAADLEGGDSSYPQDHFSQPPPPPPRKPAAKEEKKKTPQVCPLFRCVGQLCAMYCSALKSFSCAAVGVCDAEQACSGVCKSRCNTKIGC